MKDLIPQAIVRELDRYIIGQQAAKKAVAIALRNRFRRMQLPDDIRAEVTPKNIMMIGPTGVGKTEIARRIAKLANAPFVKIEVTKFTQVGYVGRDVDSIIRDLLDVSVNMLHDEKETEVKSEAEVHAQKRILEYLLAPKMSKDVEAFLDGKKDPQLTEDTVASRGKKTVKVAVRASRMAKSDTPAVQQEPAPKESAKERAARRKRIKEAFAANLLEDKIIEIELDQEDTLGAMFEYMANFTSGDSGDFVGDFVPAAFPVNRQRTRKISVRDARSVLMREEAQKLIDSDQVVDESIKRVEQNGIVFLDEIDKIVGSTVDTGPDVAGEGVQRDLLPIVEGTTVMTRFGPVKTDHILWIAAGAFHKHKPADLIPELQGRFPLRVELKSLTEEDFREILIKPKNSLTRQYTALMKTENVTIEFTQDGLEEMARYAFLMNSRSEDIGARRLHTIVEKTLEEISFAASELENTTIIIDHEFVQKRLGPVITDEDLSKYIL